MSFLKVIYLHRDLIFGVKEFTVLLLGVIFVTLIANSVQSIYADHILEDGKGIFKDENTVHMVSTNDSKYQVHVQVSMRNDQGQLISMTESSHATNIPHKITDDVFDTFMGKKEIITIDNIKYEKAEYTNTYTVSANGKSMELYFLTAWSIDFCIEIYGHGYTCIPIFETDSSIGVVTEKDVVTNQWTILRELN